MRASSGGIVRGPRARFDQIPQITVRDSRLSFRARGILVRLLSNEENFSMTAIDLAREGKEGRSAILAALKELREHGYIRTIRSQDPAGKWRTQSTVFEQPTEDGKPKFENRTSVFRMPVLQTINKEKSKEELNPTPTPPVGAGEEIDWPPSIETADREQILRKTATVQNPKHTLQEVLDEMRALIGQGLIIKNPTAWAIAGLRNGVDSTSQGRAYAKARATSKPLPRPCTNDERPPRSNEKAREAITVSKNILKGTKK